MVCPEGEAGVKLTDPRARLAVGGAVLLATACAVRHDRVSPCELTRVHVGAHLLEFAW